MTGKIIKGIAGFYYVHTEEKGIYECKARGIFRNQQIKPLVGDNVLITILDEQEKEGNITEILPRRNELLRPAVANIDQALVFFAIVKPEPDFRLLDRFLIRMEQQFVSAQRKEGLEELRRLLTGRTTALAGPSGVGKSTMINALAPEAGMETGSISRKIERGRHTTRHSEIIALGENTYLMDTPGFTSLRISEIEKEELSGYYPEFERHEPYCRFGGCAHINEPGCGVKAAVEQGQISQVRYENYKALYQELKDIRRY